MHIEEKNEEPIFLSVLEAARLLGIGRSTVYEFLRTGRLPSLTIGRRRLIARTAVEELARELEEEAVAGW